MEKLMPFRSAARRQQASKQVQDFLLVLWHLQYKWIQLRTITRLLNFSKPYEIRILPESMLKQKLFYTTS